MKLETFFYDSRSSWSREPFPDLDSPRTLVLVFGAPEFIDRPEPLQVLADAYPQAHFIGCSSSGEIFQDEVRDHSLAVAVARFAHTRVATGFARIQTVEESQDVGASLAHQLLQPDLRALIVLSDGIVVNGSALVRGLNQELPPSVLVTGGLAGDGDRFERTWVLEGRQPRTGAVTAVGLYGAQICVGHGTMGGWDIFGPERRVTRAEGNVLYELDGRPALGLYKEYLGDRAAGLPATALLFPLALRAPAGGARQVVRTVLGVDEARQAMIFAGDIPQGHLAQLMKANFDRLIDGALEAGEQAGRGVSPAEAYLAIAISCVGRRLVLGQRTEEELEATLDVLPPATRQVGFYSYGEISPYANGQCDLHNQTMTLTTITEREGADP